MDRRLHIGFVALLVVSALAAPTLATSASDGGGAPGAANGSTTAQGSPWADVPSGVSFSTLDPADSVSVVESGSPTASPASARSAASSASSASAASAASTSPPGKVVFDRDEFREQRGDRIYIPITFETGSIVDLKIYGPGFDAELKVRDRDDDDHVVVVINSYRGGDPAEGYEPLDPGDAIGISQLFREVETLPVGEYDLRLFTDTSRDRGRLFLEERRTDGLTLYRAPTTAFQDLNSTDAVRSAIDDGRVSPLARRDGGPVLADDDVLVVHMEGTGFGGAVTKPRDEDVSLLFHRLTGCEATDELLAGLESDVVVDSEANEYYAVIDTEDLRVSRVTGVGGSCDTAIRPGDRATVDLVFPPGSALAAGAGNGENVTAGPITIANRSATIEPTGLDAASNQTVAGSTTLAPGTELAVRLTGDGVDRTRTATVTADGRFATAFDLSDADRFANLSLTVSAAGSPLAGGSRSVVVGGDTAAARIADQTVAGGNPTVRVELASLPDGGFVALEHEGRVLGTSGYHEGVVRALSIPVEEPPSGSSDVRAVPYRDANGNGEFDDADQPYATIGASGPSTATVDFPVVTTTTTTTTTTPTGGTGGTDGGNDLVGLLVAALLVGGPIVLALREG